MGLLVEGQWRDRWYATKDSGGEFIRPDAVFRGTIEAGGVHPPEAGRYHLYVSYACPWAHRTLIVRALKGLGSMIGVSVVHPFMGEEGWTFDADARGATGDRLGTRRFMHEVYTDTRADFSGRVTVPVLWDEARKTIVNNESSEIIRILGTAFDDLGARPLDLYPSALRDEIDAVNDDVYANINNGVYRAGFATTQAAYDRAFDRLFAALDRMETRLARTRYLVGDRITEADWRLFTTLIRFDAVYHGHFKCNRQRIADYPNLSGYVRELYQVPGVAATVHMDHIKGHYYGSHGTINPTGIVPRGPALDFERPHGRERLPGRPLF